MGMVVRTNTMAQNAYRQLGMNNTAVGKSLEKLSSGFRINRAADDASGLAISEKMKAQIKGLEQASANSQDGISLIQTAEGATTEIHNMLNRMTELATKSANGTIQNEVDRQAIQQEVDDLNKEITRIAESTNFNGINLLDGNLSADKTMGGTGVGVDKTIAGSQKLDGVDLGDHAATKGKFEYQLKSDTGAVKGATGTPGYAVDITLELTDGSTIATRVIFDGGTAATDVGDAIKAALLANSELSDLFTVDVTGTNADAANALKLSFEAKEAGTSSLGIKDITIKSKMADSTGGGNFVDAANPTDVFTKDVDAADAVLTTTQTATDTYKQLEASGGGALTPVTGDKITIGDHTFEFMAADDYSIESGNVRVVLGANDRESLTNLVAAMKLKGISSASLTSDNMIRIDNVDQLKTSDKVEKFNNKLSFTSGSSGISFGNASAVNGTYKTSAIDQASAMTNGTFTINYTDKDGKSQSHTLTGINSDTGSVAANGKAVMDAINNDAKLKEIFSASITGSNELVLTSKNDKDGARVTGITTGTGELWAGSTTPGSSTTTAGTGKGQTMAFNNANLNSGDTFKVGEKEYQILSAADAADPSKAKAGATVIIKGANEEATANNIRIALQNDGITSKVVGTGANAKLLFEEGTAVKGSGGLKLQVGDTNAEYNHVTVSVDNLTAKGLNLDQLNVSNQDAAGDAIDVIKSAINKVSTNRANLGSLQNRLEYTINNLDTTAENMTAANSRIRDTDMAKEMMNYTKMNILTQSAQAMLAQANQAPQAILQLLQ